VLRQDLDLSDHCCRKTLIGAPHRHVATLNDVLLTVIASGLRGLLRSRGEPIKGVILPICVPVSLRWGRSDQESGN
jgi:diacylglycerol O-acyltransferase / wax synthase